MKNIREVGEKSILPVVLALLLFVVLVPPVSSADIQDIECAPVNPAFTAYIQEQEAEESPMLMCAALSPEPLADENLHMENGIIPAPVTLVWSEDPGLEGLIPDYEPPTEGYFNLRDENRLTPVKDQGQCGSCWAFASLGSLEFTLLTDTGDARDFSENNLKNTHGFDAAHNDGGNSFMSTAYLARWSGPVTETDDPYDPLSGVSPEGLSPLFHVQNVTFLPPRSDSLDNDLIKSFIKNKGGLFAGFTVNYSCFSPGAVYYYLPEDLDCKIDGGHAILLVGWDDSYPAENFNISPFNQTPAGDGAFIAKNSWGTGVGDDGLFYISYYDRTIGRFKNSNEYPDGRSENGACVLFTGEPLDNYEREYSYDPLGWTSSIGFGNQTPIYGANFFISEGYENIEAVSFYTREPGVEYEIIVISESGPEAVCVQNGTMPLPGYHTLPLIRPVSLSPGDKFMVGLALLSPTDQYPLVIEMPVDGYSSRATASSGESFVCLDGQSWSDLTDKYPDSNLCIKAFTRPQLRVPDNYGTIQEAVDAALPGETVYVGPGTYTENVILDRPVTVMGEGMPVVDGGEGGDAFAISGDSISLSGFEITGGVNGVSVRYGRIMSALSDGEPVEIRPALDHISLENLRIHDSGENGLYLNDGSSVFITDVQVSNAGKSGFVIGNTTRLTLTDSTSTGNQFAGFNITAVNDFMIQNCTATLNTQMGISLSDSNFGQFAGNTMAENGMNFAYVPFVGGLEYPILNIDVTVCENNTVDGKPVYVWDGHEDEAVPTDAGMVYLINCKNIEARGLSLERNYLGMAVIDSGAVTVSDLSSTDNYAGFACINSEDLSLSDSEIRDNQFLGLFSYGGSDLSVTSSVIADNPYATMLRAAEPSDLVLWHNSFENSAGSHLDLSANASLSSPASISYCYKDTYYRHTLGNYWDDYNGTDADGDGIGDTPYNTSTLSDPSPLMEPYQNYVLGEKPAEPYHSGGGASHASASAQKSISKGQTTSFGFTESAIYEVRETATADITDELMTVERIGLPNGMGAPVRDVYEYNEVSIYHTTDDSVMGAVLNFSVTKYWLEERGFVPEDVLLYRYHNETWNALPTSLVGGENGQYYFTATSPGFSVFAIGAEKATEATPTVISTPEAEVTVAVTAPAEPTPTQQTPLFWGPAVLSAGAALLLRRGRT